MDHAFRASALAFCLSFGAADAVAQVLTPEDLARHAEITEIALSPTGEYVALAVPSADGRETTLQILKLDGSGKTNVLRFPGKQHVADITWTDDEQVVVSRAINRPFRPQPVGYGELMASDITGKKQETLFAYIANTGFATGRRKDEGSAELVQVLDNEPGMALVSFDCWDCGEEPDTVIFKVNTRTGRREEVERANGRAGFSFDESGRARIKTEYDLDGEPKLFYRPTPGSDWMPMPKALAGYKIYSTHFHADGNTAEALVSDRGEPYQLYRLDMKAGTRAKLAGRDDLSISRLLLAGRNGQPFGVVYDGGKPQVQYLDPSSEWSKLHAGLMKAFPGQMVTLGSISRDGSKASFWAWSDRHPGGYYVIDRKSNKVQLIGEGRPWLTAGRMAPMRPFEFSARDGTKLTAFITSQGAGPKPLVVMPHGGPFGVYDYWAFNNDAQFLASRGYAVLQVNYRGSGARGDIFEKSGWGEWGGKMVDDVTDGVKWAIAQKLADPDRICTYGASYGAFSALAMPIRNPGMFKCAVGYAGVYDLPLMRRSDVLAKSKRGRSFLDRTVGKDLTVLAQMSPAQRAADLKIPVLLVHGKDDPLAKLDQYEAMRDSLVRSGTKPEVYVVEGEGHGFYSPKAQSEMYRRLAVFLDQHLGAAAAN